MRVTASSGLFASSPLATAKLSSCFSTRTFDSSNGLTIQMYFESVNKQQNNPKHLTPRSVSLQFGGSPGRQPALWGWDVGSFGV